ncbi:hypothetical protein DSL92_01285 [Billgrantia gudaonensis]|uniref:Uncharacterized protein n=1 Tax=Billgrantia gudaonensis TaxID=376427 RepID=A0A3S0R5G3_9GAMM|nr:hypothetical protein DSL92_01285 [Halomonas gudaonensis]
MPEVMIQLGRLSFRAGGPALKAWYPAAGYGNAHCPSQVASARDLRRHSAVGSGSPTRILLTNRPDRLPLHGLARYADGGWPDAADEHEEGVNCTCRPVSAPLHSQLSPGRHPGYR